MLTQDAKSKCVDTVDKYRQNLSDKIQSFCFDMNRKFIFGIDDDYGCIRKIKKSGNIVLSKTFNFKYINRQCFASENYLLICTIGSQEMTSNTSILYLFNRDLCYLHKLSYDSNISVSINTMILLNFGKKRTALFLMFNGSMVVSFFLLRAGRLSLLEKDLPIPSPKNEATSTESANNKFWFILFIRLLPSKQKKSATIQLSGIQRPRGLSMLPFVSNLTLLL